MGLKFRETAIVSGGMLIQQVTVFATGVLIARVLGASGFGVVGTLKSLSTLLLIVTPLGLDLALLKHAAFYRDKPEELRPISRVLRLLAAALNIVILAVVAVWGGGALQDIYKDIPHFRELAIITMIGMVFAVDIQISSALYRVAERVSLYAIVVNYGQPVLRLAASYAVLLAGGGVKSILWVNAAMFALTFCALEAVDWRRKIGAVAAHMADLSGRVAHILSESLWMALSLLVGQAMRFVDIIVLAALTTPQITGEYTAMSNVAQLIQIYPGAISQTIGPRIAVLYRAGDLPGISQELQAYMRRASLLGGYLFAGVAVFGAELDLVFGHGFHFSPELAFFLAIGWYVSATIAPFGYVLSMTGRHRRELVILSGGAVLLVLCLSTLIPILQEVGAALSVAASFIALNVVRCFYVIRVLGENPLRVRDLAPPVYFYGVAFVCQLAGRSLGQRDLGHLILECIAYSVLAGCLYLAIFASGDERSILLHRLSKRTA
jgi:O-antigen/teichoic acid export membrane protein